MKQNITLEQLGELSPKARTKLGYYLSPPPNIFSNEIPLLSIGQMIEYLGERYAWDIGLSIYRDVLLRDYMSKKYPNRQKYTFVVLDSVGDEMCNPKYGVTVCDALWEAVKADLESDA